MKKLKTLLVVCLLSLGFVAASAQNLNWGVKAGLNVSSLTSLDDAKFKPGFNVGVLGQYMFAGSEGFGVEAGLQYSMLGFKYEMFGESETLNASYLQLPIQALYKINAGPGLSLYPSAGIYLGYGLGGTHDYFDGAEEFDFGVKIGFNVQFEKIIIGLAYEQGLTDVPEYGDGKNSNIALSVGYLF
ncbi:porin family protein [Bacteroidales bacterium OttesenSCG-928-M11]|nr:porin family protein [Bacteroidales bacterium OttesenSCG-928-M11]